MTLPLHEFKVGAADSLGVVILDFGFPFRDTASEQLQSLAISFRLRPDQAQALADHLKRASEMVTMGSAASDPHTGH
jgi:hypothetical protein